VLPRPRAWQDQTVQQRLPSILDQPIAFGHRGARAHERENTLAAFGLALRLGATGLESDVWLTADGEAVLDHDGVVRIRARKRPIRELTRAQLPAHIPTLAELVTTHAGDWHLSLDLKDPSAAAVVFDVLNAERPDLLGRLWLCHPALDLLTELRPHAVNGVRLVHSTRLSRLPTGPERHAAVLAERRIDAMNMHHTDWNGGLATLFHRFERLTMAWDLQFEPQLRSAVRMGMDAIFSDHVDRMMDVVTAETGATS
jgi:glycerophosphoryl diester phosphodiesterase